MNLYLLSFCVDYQRPIALGIFTSIEKANQAIASDKANRIAQAKKDGCEAEIDNDEYVIEEFMADKLR